MSLLARIMKLFRSEPRQAMAITYSIRVDVSGRYILCKVCGTKSLFAGDIEQLYCGHCAQYHPVVTRKFGG